MSGLARVSDDLSLQRESDHTAWMNQCVPEMLSAGKDTEVAIAACLNIWRERWEAAHPDGADDPGPDRPQDHKPRRRRTYDTFDCKMIGDRLAMLFYFDDQLAPTSEPEASIIKVRYGDGVEILMRKRGDVMSFIDAAGIRELYVERARRLAWMRAKASAQVALKAWDESKHPRDPGGEHGGEFVSSGGSDDEAVAAELAKENLNPAVIDVGGDEWNRKTAIRLEREYQSARPKLEALLDTLGTPSTESSEDIEDLIGQLPESWDDMSNSQKEEAETQYFEQKLQGYVSDEKESWYNNGGALDTRKAELAANTTFVFDTLKEEPEENDEGGKPEKPEYPFTIEQLSDAIEIEYESDGEGNGDVVVHFDDAKLHDLKEAEAGEEEQLTFEGIEPPDYSKLLTKAMRDELSNTLAVAFEKEADASYHEVEEPDGFEDIAKQRMEDDWAYNLSSEDKFDFVLNSTQIIKQSYTEDDPVEPVAGVPKKFDPLNKTSGEDYRKTQYVARELSLRRAVEVFEERGIKMKPGVNPMTALRRVDSELWVAWKSSSTSAEGKLLQVAVADELKGRLNPKTGFGGKVELDKDAIAFDAEKEYEGIGGYDGVLAYVRAKWETTQLLLDKAGLHELELYRGIALDPGTLHEAEKGEEIHGETHEFAKLPTLNVVRNGAASTTINPSIANGWSADVNRVVLRALMPRTAAVSVPAYGINVKSEQEVVVAGTAWKEWTAWRRKAPTFKEVA